MSNIKEEREESLRLLAMLKPYFAVSARRFYLDLILTGLVAWGSLILFSRAEGLMASLFWLVLSYLGFFRGQAFIHEVIHFQKKLPLLPWLYNGLFGFPNRAPSYIHEPHQFHHLPKTFGTEKDPEYLVMKGRGRVYFLLPFLQAPLSPFLLMLRFGVFPPLLWALPRSFQETVFARASTIVVNPAYRRPLGSEAELRKARQQDLLCSLTFGASLGLVGVGLLSLKFLGGWLAVIVVATLVNIYRARVAHRYDNEESNPLSPLQALRDSVTVEGSLLSELWAPLGLRYHSLHHLAPQIPYYNLGRAHRHLKSVLPPEHPYRQQSLPSFVAGIRQYRRILLSPTKKGVDAPHFGA